MIIHNVIQPNTGKWLLRLLFLPMVLLLSMATIQVAHAQSGVTGDVCVGQYQPSPNCTAQDVKIKNLRVVTVLEACNEGTVGELEVIYEAEVTASSADRYDVGLFLALDGGLADRNDGVCFHDYLSPPLTASPTYVDYDGGGTLNDIVNGPWWNGEVSATSDTCGDIQSNTQDYKVLQQIRVACNDGDGDGRADIHTCASWDNNTNSTCTGVATAFPGTKAKCGCAYVNFDFTPNAIQLDQLTAKSPWISGSYLVGALVVIAGLGVGLSLYMRRKPGTIRVRSRDDHL